MFIIYFSTQISYIKPLLPRLFVQDYILILIHLLARLLELLLFFTPFAKLYCSTSFQLSSSLAISLSATTNLLKFKLTLPMKTKLTIYLCVIIIVENVLMYSDSVFLELLFVVQIHVILVTKKQVLVCLSELRQLLSQLTNVPSNLKKQLQFVNTTLTLTITMIGKVIIRTHLLGIMPFLGMTFRVMSAISSNFLVHDLTELSKLLNLLLS